MADEFAKAGRDLIEGAKAGLKVAGEEIMALSQELCPIDTGTLRASARVSDPVARSTLGTFVAADPYVTLSYGNGFEVNPKTGRIAAAYAVPVHERIEVRHDPPTQAKFLEDAMMEYVGFLGTTVGSMMHAIEDVTGPSQLYGFV